MESIHYNKELLRETLDYPKVQATLKAAREWVPPVHVEPGKVKELALQSYIPVSEFRRRQAVRQVLGDFNEIAKKASKLDELEKEPAEEFSLRQHELTNHKMLGKAIAPIFAIPQVPHWIKPIHAKAFFSEREQKNLILKNYQDKDTSNGMSKNASRSPSPERTVEKSTDAMKDSSKRRCSLFIGSRHRLENEKQKMKEPEERRTQWKSPYLNLREEALAAASRVQTKKLQRRIVP